MTYKQSPANAKLSAFMQKMNNTEKSPVRQIDDEFTDTRSDSRKVLDNYNAAILNFKDNPSDENRRMVTDTGLKVREKGFSNELDDTGDLVGYKQLRTGKRQKSDVYSGPIQVDRESVHKRASKEEIF
jgi:hypothetical protein